MTALKQPSQKYDNQCSQHHSMRGKPNISCQSVNPMYLLVIIHSSYFMFVRNVLFMYRFYTHSVCLINLKVIHSCHIPNSNLLTFQTLTCTYIHDPPLYQISCVVSYSHKLRTLYTTVPLEKQQFLSKELHARYGTQHSIPHPQEPTTGPYPQLVNAFLSCFFQILFSASSNLCLCLPSGIYTSGLPNTLYAFLFSTIQATCPTHLTILDLIILGDAYK